MSEGVDRLRELLRNADELATALGEHPVPPPPVGERPGYFDPEHDNNLDELVERVAGADVPVTFVVGAGASMEAGLPSWTMLVRRLLRRVAPRLAEPARTAWIGAVEETGPLAAAAIARARSGNARCFRSLLREELYGGGGSADFRPGPLSRELAAFKAAFPDATRLVTFNYDDLLERAVGELGLNVEGRADNAPVGDDIVAVRHLHGRLDDRHGDDAVVLTEADYALFPAEGSWSDDVMRGALDGLCVFVGLSFNDPNLLRWVYRGGEQRHLALLTRQSSPLLEEDVRRHLERATRARLRAARVDAYWADFYGEQAQVVHEARRKRGPGRPPRHFLERARSVAERGRRRCVPGGSRFAGRQRQVHDVLRALVEVVESVVQAAGDAADQERLGIALWGVDHDRREVTLWASSDRLNVGPESLVPVALEYASRWAAVEAVTQCNAIEIDPKVYASRWRFVRGFPLVWDGNNDRIVVGAATLTSLVPPSQSSLAALSEAEKRQLDAELAERLIRLWR